MDDDEIIILNDTKEVQSTSVVAARNLAPSGIFPLRNNDDVLLTVWIDSRERNRNATPRMLRMELTRHLATGPLSVVWPSRLPPARVEEARLEWGDVQYSLQRCIDSEDQSKQQRLGVSIERKRVNDLVQRSSDGDHLVQLFRMKAQCSLSILLIENDTRTARNVTPYNAQSKQVFDPLDPTITCEDDVYRMFGRIILSCDSVKFIQSQEEQASIRAIGAVGLMAVFASSKYTKELHEDSFQDASPSEKQINSKSNSNNNKGSKALSDQLKRAGIPWRMAKRVASVVGGPTELKALYDSCCDDSAKSRLLSHIIATGEDEDQGHLRSSTNGWSDAIYRIIVASPTNASSKSDAKTVSGEAALLLHKELLDDHGLYLSTLYKGHSPEETLERVLDNSASSSPSREEVAPRCVKISLTSEQAKKYFSSTSKADGERSFYKLSIRSDDESISHSGPIIMQTVSGSLASKTLSIFEMDGSDIVDLIRDSWSTEKGGNFVSLAKTVARLVDNICHEQGKRRSHNTRILMVCGLQPALDANARKSGYTTETISVVDLMFAELLICYDLTILQASRKNTGDRVNLVRQLALACFHCGFLVQNYNL